MPKPKHRDHDHHQNHDHDDDHDHEDRQEREDDPRSHSKVIELKWLGSAAPTPERYALAVQQWHALPGAAVFPATDVSIAAKVPAPNNWNDDDSAEEPSES